jgi:Protein of unknown function (DUF433)
MGRPNRIAADRTSALLEARADGGVTPPAFARKALRRRHADQVSDVLEYLARGMLEAEILRDFPRLKSEHIRGVFAFAAEREKRSSRH